MACDLKQSTAVEIKLGPFVDDGDGFTPTTGLTISQADVRLAKNAGDWAQKNESTTMVHEENGWYRCLLDTTDTDTLGILMVAVNEAGALPVWREFQVIPANVFDSRYSTDLLQVDAREWLGGTIATPTVTGVPEVDLTHVAGATTNVSTLATSVEAIITDTADIQPKIGTPVVTLAADIAVIEGQTDDIGAAGAGLTAITSKTDNLPSDPADASVVAGLIAGVDAKVDIVDNVVDAIKLKTDPMTYTVANQLDANTQSINDVTITGNGQVGTEFGV